ncbi:protein FAR1-RELATED SEQUENCE 8-like [Nicotiana tabacum]|uniref:Protein FAR1-RELATED SEQUENCE 8-like n=1 Tax=Nicotiana tabacum TaxID=4097 RepID=A0AC58S0B6_TOBAC
MPTTPVFYQDHNSNDEKNSTMIHNVYNIDKNFAFKNDLKFGSEEESYNAYNSYAVEKGFGVRKGPKTLNRNKEITRCLFLCSCEGKYDKLSPFQERKRQRLEYRCGCLARIKFKISNGTWEVVRYLQNEAGGIENAGFTEQDAHNFIQAHKRNMISSGDAQTLAMGGKAPRTILPIKLMP